MVWQPKAASDALRVRGFQKAFVQVKTLESFVTLGKRRRCEHWRDWRDDAEGEASVALREREGLSE